MHIRQIRHKMKRTLAGVLSGALLLTSLPASVFAQGTSSADENEYDAIMKALAEEDPEEPLKLYVVRHGGTEGEAAVTVKCSDYSAQYGKDYTARLEGLEQDIPVNPESQPILYMLGKGDHRRIFKMPMAVMMPW